MPTSTIRLKKRRIAASKRPAKTEVRGDWMAGYNRGGNLGRWLGGRGMNQIAGLKALGFCLLVLTGAAALVAQTRAEFEQWRNKLVDEILVPAGIKDPSVVKAMKATPRHEFVPLEHRAKSYYDMGLPIGDSQTISSPLIVSQMTQALKPQATDKVLEIGTGSGYQAAVLSKLVKDVYSIEIVESLGRKAK